MRSVNWRSRSLSDAGSTPWPTPVRPASQPAANVTSSSTATSANFRKRRTIVITHPFDFCNRLPRAALCAILIRTPMAETAKSESPVELFRLPPSSRTLKVLHGNDCVVALKALGEETRVRIVGLLVDEPLEVGAIAKRLQASPYNVSKHLRILREAGLLEVNKHGRKHLYALRDAIRRRAKES